jgi:branched-chain amino acid transport system permease protein
MACSGRALWNGCEARTAVSTTTRQVERPPEGRRRRLRLSTARDRFGFAIALVVACPVVILLGDNVLPGFDVYLGVLSVFAAMGAVALDLLLGVVGIASIGNAAFMAIGAFSAVGIANNHGGFILAVIVGGLASGGAGLLIGLPSLRMRGFYVVLTTLALQYIAAFGFEEIESASGASAGFILPIPHIGGWQFSSDKSWFALGAILLCAELIILHGLSRGRAGRAWRAIREHEGAASVVGVNVVRYKLIAFVISSTFIGVEGAALAYYIGSVDYASYTIDVGVSYAAMVLIGGMGTLYGPLFGAVLITILPAILQSIGSSDPTGFIGSNASSLEVLVYGVLIVLVIIVEPKGIAGLGVRAGRAVRGLASWLLHASSRGQPVAQSPGAEGSVDPLE